MADYKNIYTFLFKGLNYVISDESFLIKAHSDNRVLQTR